MASRSDDSTTEADDGALEPEDIGVSWHRNQSDDQVILGLEADQVRIAVAFPADLGHMELATMLQERDRELEHYFRTSSKRGVGHATEES